MVKILVISEAIFDRQNLPEKTIHHIEPVKQNNNWFFIKDEYRTTISDDVNTLNKNETFELILIHKGTDDVYLDALQTKLPDVSPKIEGFHSIGDEDITDAINRYDTAYVIDHYEYKRALNVKAQLLYPFLPIEIDSQTVQLINNIPNLQLYEKEDVFAAVILSSADPVGILREKVKYKNILKKVLSNLKGNKTVMEYLVSIEPILNNLDDLKSKMGPVDAERSPNEVADLIEKVADDLLSVNSWYATVDKELIV